MSQFLARLKAPRKIDVPDLTGKVALVTGGNSGIGYNTVKQLATHGAKVYIGARDEGRATAPLAQLESEGVPKGKVTWLKLDLATIKKAKAGAEEFLTKEKRLDILVNNGGLMNEPFQLNEDGISTINATAHFGHFVLTNTLLPLLKETAARPNSDVRVVTISSLSHIREPTTAPIEFGSIESFNHEYEKEKEPGYIRYCISKLLNLLFSLELQKKLEGTGILAIAVHPGTTVTPLMHDVLPRLLIPVLRYVLLTPPQGAFMPLIAATSPDIKKHSSSYEGSYLEPFGEIATPSETARNVELQLQLWNTSQKIVDGVLSGEA